jgi:dihydropteroate synthase
MGILNVTPDSFFDGGRHATAEAAVAHGLAMVEAGADIIDVGGESSRPGATPVPEDVELVRVIPVIEGLTGAAVRVSVDTVKGAVALAAIGAGATLVNDISAALWEVLGGHWSGHGSGHGSVGWVAMHMQGSPGTMQASPRYDDVVAEVHGYVLDRARSALDAGVAEVWVDPGFGFGKTLDHNLSLLRHLPELVAAAADLGCAGVMAGTSRKRFIGRLAAASLATAVAAMVAGVGMVRVHDVAATVQAARLYGPGTEPRTGPFGSMSQARGTAA